MARDRRLLLALSVAAFLCFSAALYVSLTTPGESKDPDAADVYGRGPFGYRGLVETLTALELSVRASHGELNALGGDKFVVITVPDLDASTRRRARELLDAAVGQAVLVVLPKWRPMHTLQDLATVDDLEDLRPTRFERIPDADLVELSDDLDLPFRVASAPGVAATEFAAELAGRPRKLLLRASRELLPANESDDSPPCILGDAERCLAAKVQRGDQAIAVLAEPDLLANFGLVEAENGPAAVQLIQYLRVGREVVFDATVHGYTVPRLWEGLFKPPLVYATATFVLLAALFALAGARRFGAPAHDAPELGRGRELLVENTVELLYQGGHSAHMLQRYWQATVRDLARLLRVGGEQHEVRLAGIGALLSAQDEAAQLEADVSGAAARNLDTRSILRLADRVHRFRARLSTGRRGEKRT